MGTQTPHQERRVEPRTAHKAVVIMAYGEGEKLEFETANLIDCSLHGVGIQLSRPLVLGQHFLLKLKLKKVNLVSYAVRNCTSMRRGEYRIGAQLDPLMGVDAPTQEEVLEALLACDPNP